MTNYTFVGASAVLKYQNKLLFEIQKPKHWHREKGELTIGLSCVGGRMEQGETLHQNLQREAREEISCNIDIQPIDNPFAFHFSEGITPLDPNTAENIWFLWEGNEPGYIPGIKVAVFLGEPIGEPKPVDLAGIFICDFNTLLNIQIGTIQDHINRGATLVETQTIPYDARLKPIGTAQYLIDIYHQSPEVLRPLNL